MPRHLTRRRRTPEAARTELLDAAERVFAKAPPEQVGLKEVAKAAGTSHGLITHYFGTYDGLVAATLQRRTAALREQIFAALQNTPGILSRPDELVDMVFAAFDHPVHLRLMTYMLSGERAGMTHAFALQNQGIGQVAARIVEATRPGASAKVRELVEIALMLAVAAAFGYAASRHSLAGAVGRPVSAKLDREARHTLAQMVHRYILTAEPE
jgi:TetR/AcrR family transcriptional regulator, repressor for neighboring sulfatase